ncbi:hypothetical protein BBJ28_00015662 [Nothophytophthora sp. Chile5]|nr:hypothetical protein BBJ28_00015662 [Nothophytophthora sp. Chile5]
MPEMSIELPPPTARFTSSSKGGDPSIRSSAFSSVRSSASSHNPYSASTTSSCDSSVFNTVGGVSPNSSNRKMGGFAYQYRASNDSEAPSTRSAGSTTFRLTQLAGAMSSGRGGTTKLSRVPSGRTLPSANEYEELQSATNAQSAAYTVEMEHVVEMSAPVGSHKPADDSSEINMDPDAVVGRNKRTGSVYDTIPALAGESMSPPASHMSPAPPATTYTAPAASRSEPSGHRRAPPPPPPPMAPLPPMEATEPGSYVSELPMLQALSSASESDYGEDHSTQRASTTSTDSGNTTRSGSLIALIEAKDGGGSEVAI